VAHHAGIRLGAKLKRIVGNPDSRHVSTSRVESHNQKMRRHVRCFTRLTAGHSKKIANHCRMLAPYFAYPNFVKNHSSLRVTPAMAAGIETKLRGSGGFGSHDQHIFSAKPRPEAAWPPSGEYDVSTHDLMGGWSRNLRSLTKTGAARRISVEPFPEKSRFAWWPISSRVCLQPIRRIYLARPPRIISKGPNIFVNSSSLPLPAAVLAVRLYRALGARPSCWSGWASAISARRNSTTNGEI
jgi:hypothetical protein